MADGQIVNGAAARRDARRPRGACWRAACGCALTAFAVALGVTLIAGTYVFTDTINASFDTIFTEAYEKTDVVVSPGDAVNGQDDNTRADARVGARPGASRPTASPTPRAASSTSAGPS